MPEIKTPKVTLLTHTALPLETVYSVWAASKGEDALLTPEQVRDNVDPAEVRKLFRAVIAQKIPVGEHVDFVFMFEHISVSWREQAVRHRIGTKPSPERVGADIVMADLPDLADSSFWSQCFTGDTQIRLLDGTSPTLSELAARGGEFWVYSCSKDGRIVPGRGHSARKTARKPLVEVELDNGAHVRCTADHLWMRRDGSYVEAQNLESGESLMPLYTRIDRYGYEQHRNLDSGRYEYTHRIVDAELNGELPWGQVVHHASFDKLNNDPAALQRMGKQEHIDYHAALIVARMAADPAAHSAALSAAQQKRWAELSEGERDRALERVAAARARIDPNKRDAAASALMGERWADEAWREKMTQILAANGAKTKGRRQSIQERARRSEVGKQRYARQKAAGAVPVGFNHKVVAVRVLDEVEDVYDITVDEHHNFALASGVFVHNSMRIQDMGSFADNMAYRVPESILQHEHADRLLTAYHHTMNMVQTTYKQLVALGIPMEDARELMPLGAQHRMSWKLNIGSLQHIVGKRGCWILQLGIWGPIIEGMINELAKKVDPIFSELVTPPCLKGDDFTGCIYHEENRRRYSGEDKGHAPCPLHFKHHKLPESMAKSEDIAAADTPEVQERFKVPYAEQMRQRAEAYQKFWGRDPYSGKRLRVIA